MVKQKTEKGKVLTELLRIIFPFLLSFKLYSIAKKKKATGKWKKEIPVLLHEDQYTGQHQSEVHWNKQKSKLIINMVMNKAKF